jgi:hypothetical protein
MTPTKGVIGAMLAPILIAVALGGAAGITTDGITNSVFAQEQKFTAILSDQEVPHTNSQATGLSEFTAAGGGIEYTVDALNIQGVTPGHIHSGEQGEDGRVIMTLLKNEIPTNKVSETGSITADRLEGPMAGQQLSDLVTAISNGKTYVNINKEQIQTERSGDK